LVQETDNPGAPPLGPLPCGGRAGHLPADERSDPAFGVRAEGSRRLRRVDPPPEPDLAPAGGRPDTQAGGRRQVGRLDYQSYLHNQGASLTTWQGGRLAELRGMSMTQRERPRIIRPRGRVGRFNRVQRLRLLRTVARIRADTLPLFGHLTYGERFPAAEISKVHFRETMRRLKRSHPGLSIIWRLQFQDRGAPHFHFLMWGVSFMPWQTLADTWLDVIGCASAEERAHIFPHCTSLRRAYSGRAAGVYAAKYAGAAKPEPGPEHCGRRWGVIFGQDMPWAQMASERVPWRQFYQVRRALARASGRSLRGWHRGQGLTVFVNAPAEFRRLVQQATGPPLAGGREDRAVRTGGRPVLARREEGSA